MENTIGSPKNAVLSVGKAASSMLTGALPYLTDDARGLLVTKYGHVDSSLRKDERIRIIESGHPIPDGNSLIAGETALDFVVSADRTCNLLVLVSGGASALMESLVSGVDLERLRSFTGTLLSDGYSIDEINQVRIGLSRIKGGRLLRRFPGNSIQVLGISDIPGDQAELIGSGIGAVSPPVVEPFPIPPEIATLMQPLRDEQPANSEGTLPFDFSSLLIGSNLKARTAAGKAAESLGLEVVESAECLNDDLEVLVPALAQRIVNGRPGVYLWGGEPTVRLPEKPGKGGRSQSLSLALTLALGDRTSVHGVIAGTDGTDGPTRAAGGIVGAAVDIEAARQSLVSANAGPWLSRHGRLFETGPTGTNVMDLAVLVREED